ncbi:SRPBCC family protein [Gaopeijia maritima]|uniref:SRPBCC family protein n=1 Tax=Gaopeijia maritima TaxID=3119007 RepID=A0ABU9ECV3_9BACT
MITFANLGGGRHELHTEVVLPLSRGEVFPFFAATENLERITPPELAFRIVTPTPVDIREEVRIDYRLRLFGVPFSWRTRISEWDPPHAFIDEQEAGPYHTWIHRHEFVEVTGGTRMTDRVVFRLPLAPLSTPALPIVRAQLRRIFTYRGRAIRRLLIDVD